MIYKLAFNCGQGDYFTYTYVLGNVGVAVSDPHLQQAKQAKAALLDLERAW
ncbi:MAG TPA: hypothetical protein VFB39_03140 [Solirubrobacteraceae bacterium]|nr:hypothetical protein [Solirubrobacteraceae bacterium]